MYVVKYSGLEQVFSRFQNGAITSHKLPLKPDTMEFMQKYLSILDQHIDKLNPDGLPHSEFSHQRLHCLL